MQLVSEYFCCAYDPLASCLNDVDDVHPVSALPLHIQAFVFGVLATRFHLLLKRCSTARLLSLMENLMGIESYNALNGFICWAT